jgi:hypothetical protein
MQLSITLAAITGDLLTLAAAVTNLATALAQRRLRQPYAAPAAPAADKPATKR